MTKKYINTGFAPGNAVFTDVASNPAGPNIAVCANATKHATIQGGAKVAMVSGALTINMPFQVDDCAVCPAPILNESLKLQWNFRRGTSMAAIRAELDRILAIWEDAEYLNMGVVPPVSESFLEP